MTIWGSETHICSRCNEYKGIMPLNKETLIYLGEDLDEWADELD